MPDDAPLVYYPDTRPGIARRRAGRGFCYIAPDGTRIDRGPERDRLQRMAVPPAYDKVWMTPLENGHLLATGYDSRARKQYRYHADWSLRQAETKFAHLVPFGRLLPRIRRRVLRDLTAEAGDPAFALAAAVTLIDRLALRVGNESYLRENGSRGALTLGRRNLRLKDGTLHLTFTAKGGKRVRRQLSDRRLTRVLEKVQDLPGTDLLAWIGTDGESHTLSSASLNAYLAEAAGEGGHTAKTFRTWAGTRAAFEAALAGARSIAALSQAAADALYNTPTVARTSYVHPRVIALAGQEVNLPAPVDLPQMTKAERQLLSFLES
jgi:DNA topoisomerase-1